jgi:hypothetical protein
MIYILISDRESPKDLFHIPGFEATLKIYALVPEEKWRRAGEQFVQ